MMKEPKPIKCPKCGELMRWVVSVETIIHRYWYEGELAWHDDKDGMDDYTEIKTGEHRLCCYGCDEEFLVKK